MSDTVRTLFKGGTIVIGVDVEKLSAEVIASRNYLLGASGYRTNLFG